MYLRYYGLQDTPFAITPDPAYLYLSPQHREALAHLLYGTGEHSGFVQLTGEVGTGKTTLIRALLEQNQPDLDVALCLNPQLTVVEFVAEICDELGVERSPSTNASLKTLVDALNTHLLARHAAGNRTVLIVDEAQNLSRDVLEQLRLLTNLETHTHKLMRIILVGQPELETVLQRPDLRQLAQRITARYHLRALNRTETASYIHHRLWVVAGPPDLFTDAACRVVYTCSGGVPRLINTVCERALMGGYSLEKYPITAGIVREAAREALPASDRQSPRRGWRARLVPAAVALAALGLGFMLHYGLDRFAFAQSSPSARAPAMINAGTPATAADANTAAREADAPTLAPRPPLAKAQTPAGSLARDAGEPEVAGVDVPQFVSPLTPVPPDTNPGKVAAVAVDSVAAVPSDSAPAPLPAGDADLTQLLRLWGVFGEAVEASCRRLAVADLRCFELVGGSLADLEALNRPALLTLKRSDGPSQRVLVSDLEADAATLVLADGIRRMARSRLANLWTGRAQIIWRRPIAVRYVQSGSVGSAVVWVRQQLALAAGVNPDTRASKPSPVFDAALAEQLRAFQSRAGLQPDGIVGPRTILAFSNRAPAPGTPLLVPSG